MELHQAQTIIGNFLSSPDRHEDCLNLDEYLGALTAALSCPEYFRDGELAMVVLGEEYRDDHPWFEDEQVYSARIICENELNEALALDRFDLHQRYPHQVTDQKPSVQFSRWCHGYLLGYLLTEEVWQEAFEFLDTEGLGDTQENHQGLLTLLAAMADWQVALADAKDPQKLANGFGEALDAIIDGVKITYQLAALLEENRLRSEQERMSAIRLTPKIGRNDACPCGSGKKYKKCCLNLAIDNIEP